MRTTISNIARHAGVSPATVDRVLNARGGVRPRTCELVLKAAEHLGYFGEATEARPVRIAIVLPCIDDPFMRQLRHHLAIEAGGRQDVEMLLHDVEGWPPSRIVERLQALRGRSDAVAVTGPDHPEMRAEIERLTGAGIRVATLISDITGVEKTGYTGIDNRAAGRLAGLLVGRLLPDDAGRNVALFTGSTAYRSHIDREAGFLAIMAEEFPDLRVIAFPPMDSNSEQSHATMTRILAEQPIGAIYNLATGNRGIASALRQAHLSRRTVFVGHELTDATRLMLLDRTMDAVIDQNPQAAAREILRLLAGAVVGNHGVSDPPRLQVVFRENIPIG